MPERHLIIKPETSLARLNHGEVRLLLSRDIPSLSNCQGAGASCDQWTATEF